MNLYKSIKLQTALTLLVAASVPQLAHALPAYEPSDIGPVTNSGALRHHAQRPAYVPFATDFPKGKQPAAGATRHHAQRPAYVPFATDFPKGKQPAAGATTRGAATFLTPAALKAMGARYQAMADYYNNRSAASSSSLGRESAGSPTNGYVVGGNLVTPAQAAQAHTAVPPATRAKATTVRPDDRATPRGIDVAQPAPSSTGSSFDWGDATIGAAGGIGASLLVLGAMLLATVSRRQRVATR